MKNSPDNPQTRHSLPLAFYLGMRLGEQDNYSSIFNVMLRPLYMPYIHLYEDTTVSVRLQYSSTELLSKVTMYS